MYWLPPLDFENCSTNFLSVYILIELCEEAYGLILELMKLGIEPSLSLPLRVFLSLELESIEVLVIEVFPKLSSSLLKASF